MVYHIILVIKNRILRCASDSKFQSNGRLSVIGLQFQDIGKSVAAAAIKVVFPQKVLYLFEDAGQATCSSIGNNDYTIIQKETPAEIE